MKGMVYLRVVPCARASLRLTPKSWDVHCGRDNQRKLALVRGKAYEEALKSCVCSLPSVICHHYSRNRAMAE
jgi:hypothetical protein